MKWNEHAITIEEACRISAAKPALADNAAPVISKGERERSELQPIEGTRVFDDIYWVGSRSVGAIAIDTGDGLILIDDGSNEEEARFMERSIRRLGLDPADIRMIIISHEHFDHYGGTTYFLEQVCPNAKVAISRLGWNLLQTVPTEFAFTQPRPTRADLLLEDGMCIRHGHTEILTVATPGHSLGCMSFIISSAWKGEPLRVAMLGGSAVWPNQPEIRSYQSSLAYFKLFTDLAQCNAFTGTHQPQAAIDAVRLAVEGEGSHPWICRPEELDQVYYQDYRDRLVKTLQNPGLQTYRKPVPAKGGLPRIEGSPIPELEE